MTGVELAVVLVTWNVRDLALAAVRSLLDDLAASGLAAAVWLVDNASADGTADAVRAEFPQLHLIASEDNLGFAGGNNLALCTIGFGDPAVADDDLPRAVFLLNPDTLVQPGAVRALYEALFAAPEVGLVGARLSYEDGSFQHGAFHFPGIWQTLFDLFPMPGRLYEGALNGRYPRASYDASQPFAVDHVLGATMLLRREVIRATGMFDERYFMYCEEIDWQMRIRRAGWEIRCVPEAHITHLAGQSTRQVRAESLLNLWRSRMMLYTRHYGPLRVAVIRALVRLGMRRKIAQAQADAALESAQRETLIAAYRAVAAL
ncbi:MAG: glycosyltransferase family 2 protein [Anaerolineae bacterium]|nr:glycosyltransferase family 2 protein [Anaerolineae bacterium]